MSTLSKFFVTLASMFYRYVLTNIRAFILQLAQTASSKPMLARLASFFTYRPLRLLRQDHAERFWDTKTDWELAKLLLFQYQPWLVNYILLRRNFLLRWQASQILLYVQTIFLIWLDWKGDAEFWSKLRSYLIEHNEEEVEKWHYYANEIFFFKKPFRLGYLPIWLQKTLIAPKHWFLVMCQALIADFFYWLNDQINAGLVKVKDWLWEQWYIWHREWLIGLSIACVIAILFLGSLFYRDEIASLLTSKPAPTTIVLLSPVIPSPLPEPTEISQESAATQVPETPPQPNPITLHNIDGIMFIEVDGHSYAEGELLGTLVSRVVHDDQSIIITVEINGQLYQSTQADAYIIKYSREGGTQLLTSHGEVQPEGEVNYTGFISVYGHGLLFDMMGTPKYDALLTDVDHYILDLYYRAWTTGAHGENKSGVYYNITPDDYPELPGAEYPAPWNLCQYMRYYWWFAPQVDLKGLCDPEVSPFAYPDGEYLTHFLEQSGITTGYYFDHDQLFTQVLVKEAVDETVYATLGVFPNLPENAKTSQTLTCQNSPVPNIYVFSYKDENAYLWDVRYPQTVVISQVQEGYKKSRGQLGFGVYIALISDEQLRSHPASDFTELTAELEYFQITDQLDCR